MPLAPAPTTADQAPRPSARLPLRYLSLVPAAIVIAGLYFGRPVLLPLAVAVLLAFALAPLVGWLRRIGMGRALSVMIAASLSVAVMIAVGFFIASKTVELADELPRYQSTLIEKVQSLRGTTLETGAVERVFSLLKNLREQVSGTGKAPAPAPRAAEPASSDQKPVQVEIKEPELAPIQIAATVIPP